MNAAYQTQLDTYKRNTYYTADQGTILLLLYQGAMDFLKKAIDRLDEGDCVGKSTYISKAHAIISEFVSSLNHDVGGDLSRTLEELYRFMLDQLMQAHIGNDAKPLRDVIALLETLQSGWKDAVVQARQQGLL